MLAFRFPFAAAALAAVFTAGSVHAQAQDGPPLPVDVMTAVPDAPFRIETVPRTYVGNANERDANRIFDNGSAFGVYRTDPRLVAGINLNRYLAIEGGYTNLVNRGHYLADYARPDDVAGALGVKGYNSYLATKLTLPLGDRLHVIGKLGVARSQYNRPGMGATSREVDAGAYASVGLEYDLGKNATLVGAYEMYGNTERRWGANTNNNGFSLKLNVGF